MNIALVNHPGLKVVEGIQIQSPSPSIGLAYIGAYLRSHNYSYTAIDGCGEAMDQIRPYNSKTNILVQGLTDDEILSRIPADVQLLGFSCLFSQCWPLVYRILRQARHAFPHAVIVAGGEHPTALPGPILRSGLVDLIVSGEGEETFVELAKAIDQGSSWKGMAGTVHLADSDDGAIQTNPRRIRLTNVDALPYPDWDSWSIEQYIAHEQVAGIRQGRQMPILGSRGCPFACTFCSNEPMWTQRYIMRDPSKLVDEMEFMQKRYRVSGFTFMDSTFIVNREKVLRFCEALIQRKLDVHFQLPAGTRCEAFSQDLAFALERAGLKNFAFAPESADEEILKAIKKQVSIPKLIQAIGYTLQTRMTVACFIVIGFPGDTRRSLKRTLALVRRLAFLGVHDVTVSHFTPYPGSPLYEEFRKTARVTDCFDHYDGMTNFFSAEGESFCDAYSWKDLHRWMLWMYLNFYLLSGLLRPWRVVKHLYNYFRHGVEQARYIRVIDELLRLRRTKWVGRLPPERFVPR